MRPHPLTLAAARWRRAEARRSALIVLGCIAAASGLLALACAVAAPGALSITMLAVATVAFVGGALLASHAID